MAVIQKLRKSGMVMIVIIAALVLFVVGDILTNNKLGLTGEDMDVVGIVSGHKIKEKEVTAKAEQLFELFKQRDTKGDLNDPDKLKQAIEQAWSQAWTELVKKYTFDEEIRLSGVKITDEDINELLVGDNPLEDIKGDPTFQTDNKFDRKKVEDLFRRYRKDASMKGQLLKYLEGIRNTESEKRYINYISKALKKSKTSRKYDYIASNQGASGRLIALNYSTIPDKDIKVTESDLQKYLDAHREQYKQDFNSRDIQYVVWEIIPTPEDSAYAKQQAEQAAKSLAADTKPDTAGPDVVGYFSRGSLPSKTPKEVAEIVWPSAMNAVSGPFYADGKYTVYQKLAERRDTTPMINVAHILVKVGEAPNKTLIKDSIEAEKKANELATQIRGGADIGKLAAEWSSDPGSAQSGGTYGWVGPEQYNQYVPEYKAFCLRAKKGQIEVVKTSFGFHVMKATEDPDYTQVKYRVQSFEINPGTQTVRVADQASRKFRNAVVNGDAKSFETARDKMALTPRLLKDIKTDEKNIPGIDQPADVKSIYMWLFDKERKESDVSDVFAFATRHIVIMVTKSRNAGYAKVSDVKDKIEPLVKNELKAAKLAEKLTKAAEGAKRPEDVAQKSGGALISIESLKMGQNFIPQLFNEPAILGAIFGVKEKAFSKPVAGLNAVAMIYIEKRDKIDVPNSAISTSQMDFATQPMFLGNQLKEAVRKASNVQDYRYKFPWF